MQVQRRIVAPRQKWENFRFVVTNRRGQFEERVTIRRSAEYRAITPATPRCARAKSDSLLVNARARVITFVGDATPERGRNFRVHGRVEPRHPDTRIALQRRKKGDWVTVQAQELSARSTFSFFPLATWKGRRTFRIRWPRGDFDHIAGYGRVFEITTH
ncbi:MAG: hypothetical protein M3238_00925 [Actinomycetota bacterium]|nr:hypothetical protein [Actinomycetota bacterium]